MKGNNGINLKGLYPRGFPSSLIWPWPLVRSDELIELKYGKGLRTQEREPGSVPVYGTNGPCGWHNKALSKGPGIILGRKGQGPLGVEWSKSPFWVIDTAYYVAPKTDAINLKFYYYLIKYIGLNHLKDGTSNPSLSRNTFGALLLPHPPLLEQRAIAHVLGAIDNKIELNHRMNETLESIAQALFVSWFVNFDPVRARAEGRPIELPPEFDELFPDEFMDSELGEIPMGWDVTTIGQKLKTFLGGTPSRRNEEFWCNGTIPWINSGMVNEFRITQPKELITELGMKKSATKLLPKRTTVLAITGATLGQVSLLEIDTCVNQSVIGILESKEFPSEFIYFWIKEKIEHLVSLQTGGAQQHINKKNVDSFKLLIPTLPLLKKFEHIVRPLFNRISNNLFESFQLARIRDTLLPKLISGQIRIEEPEKFLADRGLSITSH